jgi:hypothetical protein
VSATPQRPVEATPQDHLETVESLIRRHRVVEQLVHRQGEHDKRKPALVEGLVHKQNLTELRGRLERMHPADVAYVLENLPLDDRLLVWDEVGEDRGEILLEVSDAVRDTLLADMENAEIVAATQDLDADEIADLAPDLPQEVVQDIIEAQDVEDRAELQTALSFPEGTVGALMDFEVVSIREDVTCEVALRYLRRFDELPAQTDAALRGRPRRPPEGNAAAEAPAGDRSRRADRRALPERGGLLRPGGGRRRGGRGVRPLRPGERAGDRFRSAGRRARHRRAGARIRPREAGGAEPRQGGPARGGGHLRRASGRAPRTAVRGSRSTCAPPSSPRASSAPSRARSRSWRRSRR